MLQMILPCELPCEILVCVGARDVLQVTGMYLCIMYGGPVVHGFMDQLSGSTLVAWCQIFNTFSSNYADVSRIFNIP